MTVRKLPGVGDITALRYSNIRAAKIANIDCGQVWASHTLYMSGEVHVAQQWIAYTWQLGDMTAPDPEDEAQLRLIIACDEAEQAERG